jgi:hypothetical protein
MTGCGPRCESREWGREPAPQRGRSKGCQEAHTALARPQGRDGGASPPALQPARPRQQRQPSSPLARKTDVAVEGAHPGWSRTAAEHSKRSMPRTWDPRDS